MVQFFLGPVYKKKFKHLEICCNYPKFFNNVVLPRPVPPKGVDGIANNVDPDQTAPWDLDLYSLLRLVCPKTYDHYSSYSAYLVNQGQLVLFSTLSEEAFQCYHVPYSGKKSNVKREWKKKQRTVR